MQFEARNSSFSSEKYQEYIQNILEVWSQKNTPLPLFHRPRNHKSHHPLPPKENSQKSFTSNHWIRKQIFCKSKKTFSTPIPQNSLYKWMFLVGFYAGVGVYMWGLYPGVTKLNEVKRCSLISSHFSLSLAGNSCFWRSIIGSLEFGWAFIRGEGGGAYMYLFFIIFNPSIGSMTQTSGKCGKPLF